MTDSPAVIRCDSRPPGDAISTGDKGTFREKRWENGEMWNGKM